MRWPLSRGLESKAISWAEKRESLRWSSLEPLSLPQKLKPLMPSSEVKPLPKERKPATRRKPRLSESKPSNPPE